MRTGNDAGSYGCGEFRAALSRALEGQPMPDELTVLGWHEHLLSCAECRLLLEREEALEALLATMPRPSLPPDLTRRVLLRLRENREEAPGLDRLLELADVAPPAGLSGRVTAGLRGERALDRLLEQDRAPVPEGLAGRVRAGIALERLLELDPEPVVPEGLAADVLQALEPERRGPIEAAPRRLRLLRSPVFYAAAAGLLFAVTSLTLWWGRDQAVDPGDDDRVVVEGLATEPTPELLANIDLLGDEFWEETPSGPEIRESGADLPLLLHDELDVEDELLLGFEDGEGS